jgi:hypothetical protein
MQNAKDTFYEVLRMRLAAVNPERTVVLRGVVRPGVLVEENELVTDAAPVDCFRLRWTAAVCEAQSPMPVVTLACEVVYETVGTAVNSGMDRGRALAAMDGELLQIVNAAPKNAPKVNYAGLAFGKSVAPMQTQIWWGDVTFGPEQVKDERVMRTATVAVMSYQEAGEL